MFRFVGLYFKEIIKQRNKTKQNKMWFQAKSVWLAIVMENRTFLSKNQTSLEMLKKTRNEKWVRSFYQLFITGKQCFSLHRVRHSKY